MAAGQRPRDAGFSDVGRIRERSQDHARGRAEDAHLPAVGLTRRAARMRCPGCFYGVLDCGGLSLILTLKLPSRMAFWRASTLATSPPGSLPSNVPSGASIDPW